MRRNTIAAFAALFACFSVGLPAAGCLTDPGLLGGIDGSSGTETAQGEDDSGPGASGASPGDSDPSGSTGEPGDPTDGDAPCVVDIAPAPARYMTGEQVHNTMEDLLGVTVGVPEWTHQRAGRFHAVSQASVGEYHNRYAEAASIGAQAADLGLLLDCDPNTVSEPQAESCVVIFLNTFLERAWRRFVSPSELLDVLTAYQVSGGTFDDRVRATLRYVFASDDFVRLEDGVVGDDSGQVVELDAYGLASRLSYFLWNSTPDEALLAVARDNSLLDPSAYEEQVHRMIGDDRSRRSIGQLYDQLLGLDTLEKDPEDFAFWDDALVGLLRESLRLGAADTVVGGGDGTLFTLLTDPTMYLNDRLAGVYQASLDGPPPTTAAFERVSMNTERRHGLLSHPAFLAASTGPHAEVGWSLRGTAVLRDLLCAEIPESPPDADEGPDLEGMGRREGWEATVGTVSGCIPCHDLTDPITFSLDHYDAAGVWRSEIAGEPIDDAVEHPYFGEFEGVDGLAAAILAHPETDVCMARTYATFALRRSFGRGVEECRAEQLAGEFDAQGDLLTWLLRGVALMPEFRVVRVSQ